MKTVSFRDQVADFFKARPNEWIAAVAFESVGGRQAWRSRIAECRTELGLAIENRQRTVLGADGRRYRISEYRFTGESFRLTA